MKILITYFSQTGNTEKIAQAIYEVSSKNHESTLKKLKKVKIEELEDYDLVFIGSPCHDSDLAKPALRFLKKIPDSPKYAIAGFILTPPFYQKETKGLKSYLRSGQVNVLRHLKM